MILNGSEQNGEGRDRRQLDFGRALNGRLNQRPERMSDFAHVYPTFYVDFYVL